MPSSSAIWTPSRWPRLTRRNGRPGPTPARIRARQADACPGAVRQSVHVLRLAVRASLYRMLRSDPDAGLSLLRVAFTRMPVHDLPLARYGSLFPKEIAAIIAGLGGGSALRSRCSPEAPGRVHALRTVGGRRAAQPA